MEGIRLRSDSTGSTKSAFYQGTIVSTTKSVANGDTSAAIESGGTNNRSRRGGTRSGVRQKDRKLPPGKRKKHDGIPSDVSRSTDVADVHSLPEIGREMCSPPRVSPFAPPGGYYCQNSRPQPYAVEQHLIPQEYLPLRGRDQFTSLATTILDRSLPTMSDRSTELWLTGAGAIASSHRQDHFVEESPSMDDTELQGMSLDFDHSPMSSPTKSGGLFADDRGLHSWPNHPFHPQGEHMQYQVPPPPPVSYSTQYGSLYDHPSYGTTPPLKTATHGYRQNDAHFHSGTTAEYETAGSGIGNRSTFAKHFWEFVDVSKWLTVDVRYDDDGTPLPEEDSNNVSLATFLRLILFNPIYPEFTSLQQFSWAVILGIQMGLLTAIWKTLIESCVDFVWKTIPETLLGWGVFTDLDGMFPVYHYMWITPSIFGGALSYIFAALPTPIPGQNEWIHSLHSRGVQDFSTFWLLFLLSTAGMASGLSLGPELPLILTSGMIGSWLGVLCKQSILSARVLNLTAASAAIGGFFGFPMAGALFVLEVPHRMGMQYFEALTPATISSIVAVLTNRLATNDDVNGYYSYPWLNESLPSSIFHDAIAFGLFGGALGIVYTRVVLTLKTFVHDLLHKHNDVPHEPKEKQDVTHITESTDETWPLLDEVETSFPSSRKGSRLFAHDIYEKVSHIAIGHEPTRAGVVGSIIGSIVGVTCIFFPHVMFWGESQLQNLIDKGRTPLPVFGQGDEPSSGLVSLGFCMADRRNGDDVQVGFSLGCSAAIALAKIFVTGLSLGTGIVGGHFWAPLFVGCAASHFLTDSIAVISNSLNISMSLSSYPCVALLCIMGSCHVVVFRAHIAIILILTLTIDGFGPENAVGGAFRVAGDYSAVFPLLTVAVFVALQISRQTVFYEKQRSRGDILALPEVLCEPGKEGRPLVMDYDGNLHELDESDYEYESDSEGSSPNATPSFRATNDDGATQSDIEAHFNAQVQQMRWKEASREGSSKARSPLPPRPKEKKWPRSPPLLGGSHAGQKEEQNVDSPTYTRRPIDSAEGTFVKDSTLDDLLNTPMSSRPRTSAQKKTHRRTRSEPVHDGVNLTTLWGTGKSFRERSDTSSGSLASLKAPVALKCVNSFGQVDQEQPSLLDQARKRSASFASAEKSKMAHIRGAPLGSPKTVSRKASV